MAIKTYYGLSGTTQSALDESNTFVQVSAAFSGTLVSGGFVNNEDETYLLISSAGKSEVVKVTAIEGTLLTIEREQSGTLPIPHPLGATIAFVLTAEAVSNNVVVDIDIVSENENMLTIERDGNVFSLNIDSPTFTGERGIDIIGKWPDITIDYTAPEGNCCGGGSSSSGGGAINGIEGEGIVHVNVNGSGVATVNVDPPYFNGSGGISISGEWPYYNFEVAGGGGGGGTVTSVSAGAGLTLTGSPSVNPTLAITNTGVTPGDYGGIQINGRGQVTAVPATLNPISIAVAGSGISISRLSDAVTITSTDGAVGVRGALALADDSDDFDPLDDVNAVSPAYLDMVLTGISKVSIASTSYSLSEMFADYSNAIGGTAQSLVLTTGQKAFILAEATMLNASTPATPVNFGIGVLSASAVIGGNKKMTQSQQSITFMLTGPFNDTIALATTAVPSGSTVISYGLTAIILP